MWKAAAAFHCREITQGHLGAVYLITRNPLDFIVGTVTMFWLLRGLGVW